MTDLARREDSALSVSLEAEVLARMEGARRELAAARNVGDAKRVADAAAVVCEWLRRQSQVGLEIVNDGQLLKLQAEARIGEFLQQPGAVKERGRPEKITAPERISPPSLRDLGMKRGAAERCRRVADIPPEVLTETAEKATQNGKELSRDAVLKEAKRRERAARPRTEQPETHSEPAGQILTGDARKLARQIPDASVALVLADPVWERLEDYEWLARECERVLVPGGSLIVQCGNLRRFETEVALRRSGLVYVDLLAEVYPFALSPLRNIKVQVGWKPHYWFSKGPRRDMNGRNLIARTYTGEDSGWVMNRTQAKGKRSADASKDLHEWGDAEDFTLGVLERLCGAGEVVWDPFTGSGTVPVVCRRLGLPFVAFEVDPESATLARERLAGTRREVTAQGSLWEEEAVL